VAGGLGVTVVVVIIGTFVDVDTRESITIIAVQASTRERTSGINALCVLAAWGSVALVNVDATNTITSPSRITGTCEATVSVGTRGVGVAVVCFELTFVEIGTIESVTLIPIATSAIKTAVMVGAETIFVAV